jgi:release factor glutamine methyltransferase
LKNIFSTFADQLKRDLLALSIDEQEAEAESDLILLHITGLTRAQRLIAVQSEVPSLWQNEIARILSQRRLRVPIQYCLGSTKFMGLEFFVEAGVLIPRGDTETLVKVVLDLLSERYKGAEPPPPLSIAEIGVGAGPIAISLLKNLKNAKLWACDVSERAIDLTRRNAELHGVSDRLELVLADWKDQLPVGLDVIVANPPYIPRDEKVHLAAEIAWHEPDVALFTEDDDGLAFYKNFAALLPKHLLPGRSFAAFECGDKQGRLINSLFRAANWRQVKIYQDVNGIDRVLSAIAPNTTSKFS